MSDSKALKHWLSVIKPRGLALSPREEPNTGVQCLCWVVIEYLGTDAITGLESHGQRPVPIRYCLKTRLRESKSTKPRGTLWGSYNEAKTWKPLRPPQLQSQAGPERSCQQGFLKFF